MAERRAEINPAETLKSAIAQAAQYQRRIDNQRQIIDRYDAFRRWALSDLVPEMQAWANELDEIGQPTAAQHAQEWADNVRLRAENPPESA